MKLRTLGKTGIEVSEIGVGGHQNMVGISSLSNHQRRSWRTSFNDQVPAMSDLDRAKVIERALDLGVNYFDTSTDPETESLGKSLKIIARRDECVATLVAGVFQYLRPDTSTYWARKAVSQDIDQGLSLFGYDYFDVCLTCMCNNWYGHNMIEGALTAMAEAKQAGKIRAVGISDHQNGEFLSYIIERYHDMLDVIMYPFSYVRQGAKKTIFPLIKKYNLGFIAMKPLAQGRIFENSAFHKHTEAVSASPAVSALRWVLDYPEVSVALAAVNALHEIEENCVASP